MAENTERSTGETTALQRAKSGQLSEATKKSSEGVETKNEAKSSLEQLKQDIENGKISPEIVQKYLESIDELKDAEFKPIVLGMILSGLNRKGIKFGEIKDGKLFLSKGNDSIIDNDLYANDNERKEYEKLLNKYISMGKITLQDITTTYLFRTSGISEASKEKLTTTQYVVKLLKKYNITVTSDKGEALETFSFQNKAQYIAINEAIHEHITDNQADKEFLLLYFNDKYNKNKLVTNNQVGQYQSFEKKANKSFIEELNVLDDRTKAVLGIRNKNDEKDFVNKWKYTTKAALTESMKNNGAALGLFFGVIGWILWGKKGFLGGLIGGLAYAGGGDKMLKNLYQKGINSVSGKKGDGEKPTNEESEKNTVFNKYKSDVSNNLGNLDKDKTLKTLEELGDNDKFLKAPASTLKIFDTQSDSVQLAKDLALIGINITSENTPYYKHIFSSILQNREKNIGNFQENENIKSYLERTSKKEEKNTNQKAVAAVSATTEKLGKNQSRDEKGWLITGEKNPDGTVKNGERRDSSNTVIEKYENGKLIYVYQGEFENGKFTGVVNYKDGTGKTEIFEKGEKVDYTLEYIGGLIGLLGVSLAPSAGGPVGVGVSAVIGSGYSIADICNQDEDLLRDILKSCNIVDPRFEGGKKTLWDNVFAAVGIIPGMKQIGLTAKISKLTSKLSPEKMAIVNNVSEKVINRIKGGITNLGQKGGQVVEEVGKTTISPERVKIIQKHILSNENLSKVGDSIDVGGIQIIKVEKGYQIGNDTSKIYKSLDEIITNPQLIPHQNLANYGTKVIDTAVKSRISEVNFKIGGKEYFFDKKNNIFKVKNGTVFENVPEKFVEENFEFLFHKMAGYSVKEGFTGFTNSVKKMKFKDFAKKFAGYGELKDNPKWYNYTLVELLTFPKVIKQLSELSFKGNMLGGSKELTKILVLGDKNRTIKDGLGRAGVVTGAVSMDGLIGDSNDSELTDALFYMYGGVLATAIGTALFDEK